MRKAGAFGLVIIAAAFTAMFFQLPPDLRPLAWGWLFIGMPLCLLATAWHRQDVERDKARLAMGSTQRVPGRRHRSTAPKKEEGLRVINHTESVGEGRYVVGKGRVEEWT